MHGRHSGLDRLFGCGDLSGFCREPFECSHGAAHLIMLNDYAVDWRWFRDRGDSPWYPTVKLFRQPRQGDWAAVLDRIQRFLPTFTV